MDRSTAIWNDIDMIVAGILGFVVGAVIALLIKG